MDKCPICEGEGKRIIVVKNLQTNRMKTITDWCLCLKSEFISKTYDMLTWLGSTYLPLDKIDERLFLNLEDLSKSPNLYITNTNLHTFNLHVKSILIKYRFINNHPSIYYCKAIDILKRFYVKQEDGSSPSLSDLNKYDLVIFTLDTMEKNEQLRTCVLQVVYNRDCIRRPTWVFLPKLMSLENTREYTEELKAFLKPVIPENIGDSENNGYKEISIAETNMKIKHKKTISQKKAENGIFSRGNKQ